MHLETALQRLAKARAIRSIPRVPPAVTLAVFTGASAVLWAPTVAAWWTAWSDRYGYYPHAILAPIVLLLILWRRRAEIARAPVAPRWHGMVFAGLAIGIQVLALNADVLFAQTVAAFLYAIGLIVMLAGPWKLRAYAPAIVFAVAFFPFVPDSILSLVAFPVQTMSLHLATRLLSLFGAPAAAVGNVLILPHYRMAVGDACAGFRTLFGVTTLAAAFAYLVDGAPRRRWILGLLAVPLGVAANSVRIAIIGDVGETFGHAAAAWAHDLSGIVVLMACYLIILAVAKVLRCETVIGIRLRRDAVPTEGPMAWFADRARWRPEPGSLTPVAPMLLTLSVALLAGLGAVALARRASTAPRYVKASQVPAVLTGGGIVFEAEHSPANDKLTSADAGQLHPLAVVSRTYDGSDSSRVAVFVAAGNLRHTFHDPHTCALGDGATLTDVGPVSVATNVGPVALEEADVHFDGDTRWYKMFYGYLVDGNNLRSAADAQRRLVRQTVLGAGNHTSYFLRFLQCRPGVSTERRHELSHFVAGFWQRFSASLARPAGGTDTP